MTEPSGYLTADEIARVAKAHREMAAAVAATCMRCGGDGIDPRAPGTTCGRCGGTGEEPTGGD